MECYFILIQFWGLWNYFTVGWFILCSVFCVSINRFGNHCVLLHWKCLLILCLTDFCAITSSAEHLSSFFFWTDGYSPVIALSLQIVYFNFNEACRKKNSCCVCAQMIIESDSSRRQLRGRGDGGEKETAEVVEKWGEEHRMKELKSVSSNESYEWSAFERLPNAEKKRTGAWRCIVPSWEACVCMCAEYCWVRICSLSPQYHC